MANFEYSRTVYARPYLDKIKDDSYFLSELPKEIDLYGRMLSYTESVYLSAANSNALINLQYFNTFADRGYLSSLYPAFSAQKITDYIIMNNNLLSAVKIPLITGGIDTDFRFIIENDAGYNVSQTISLQTLNIINLSIISNTNNIYTIDIQKNIELGHVLNVSQIYTIDIQKNIELDHVLNVSQIYSPNFVGAPNALYLSTSEPLLLSGGAPLLLYQELSSSWTPSDLIETIAWYDASDYSSITESSGAVSVWSDKSGNSYDANLTNGYNAPTTAPTYRSSDARAGSGLPTITADNANGYVGVTTPSFSASEVMFICALYTNDGTGAITDTLATTFDGYQTMFSGIGTAGIQRIMGNSGFNFWYNSTVLTNDTYENGAYATVTTPDMSWSLHRMVFDSPSILQTWGLGYNQRTSGRNWTGPIGEIVFLASPLNTTDAQKLEGYLAHKWELADKLPIDHPYKATPP